MRETPGGSKNRHSGRSEAKSRIHKPLIQMHFRFAGTTNSTVTRNSELGRSVLQHPVKPVGSDPNPQCVAGKQQRTLSTARDQATERTVPQRGDPQINQELSQIPT
jgi:hypothetical protein